MKNFSRVYIFRMYKEKYGLFDSFLSSVGWVTWS